MITQTQYLPPLMRMSDTEAAEYWSDFRAWLGEELPKLQASAEWGREEEIVFDRGLVLVSALSRARDFIQAAYRWTTTEKRISNFLYYVEQIHTHLVQRGITEGESDYRTGRGTKFVDQYQMRRHFRQSMKQVVSQTKERMEQVAREYIDPDEEDDDRRPQHFDQYKHLLPEPLREEGERIGELYLEFADVCNKLELVANNPNGTKQDRAFYARKACAIEDKIKNFWHRVDIAYAQTTGKDVSDEYIEVINAETAKVNGTPRERQDGEHTKFEIDKMPEGEEKELLRKHRIERDKKLLRKSDRKGDERHGKNLFAAATELHEWGFLITATQYAVCQQFGVTLDPSWLEPSKEEKAALKKESKTRSKANKIEREMNAAEG